MKRNMIAAVLSGLLPGAGQFYNRQWLKGIAFLAPILILSAFVSPEMLLSEPDQDFSPEIEAAWEEEIARRIDDVKAGSAQSKSFDLVFADVDRRFPS